MKKPTIPESAQVPAIEIRGLRVFSPSRQILRDVCLSIPRGSVFALLGPSGAGKSTFLRCVNRLIELSAGLRVQGEILLMGRSIYAPGVDVDALRARVGILFQQPAVFPGSVRKNVLFGVRHLGKAPKRLWPDIAEQALRDAALWVEVKDRMEDSALELSAGQQQRLCLARALAVEPEVLLLDEPTSALDPISTEAIEQSMSRLRGRRTLVMVTHDPRQARRLADHVACLHLRDGAGELAETGF